MIDEAAMAAKIEANVAEIREKLRTWATHMAGRYNAPLYLTGSTLHNPAPRDCDIRIVIADHEFAARYGHELREFEKPIERKGRNTVHKGVHWDAEGPTQRWIDDLAKFNGIWSVRLGRNMDIQVWPESYYRDTYPPPILLAEPSPRWWIYNKHVPDPTQAVG